MSRSSKCISRHSDSNENSDHWLKQFEATLQKTSVQAREPTSLFDQINSIMNNSKSKYTSVQGVVDNMLERSGLKAYLDHVKISQEKEIIEPKKIAQIVSKEQNKIPQVIQDKPSIQRTLENLVKESHGNLSVPALITRLRALHARDISNEADWEDERLLRLVSQMNLQAKKDNPASYDNYDTLGMNDHFTNEDDSDASNRDAFTALLPAKTNV